MDLEVETDATSTSIAGSLYSYFYGFKMSHKNFWVGFWACTLWQFFVGWFTDDVVLIDECEKGLDCKLQLWNVKALGRVEQNPSAYNFTLIILW